MGRGGWPARTGNHRCSLSTCRAYWRALGSRTGMSSPRRKVVLPHPSSSTGVTGRPAHSGNCAATSRDTSADVMAALPTEGIISYPSPDRTHIFRVPGARGHDLSPGYYATRIDKDPKTRNHVRQLEALGFTVTLAPPPDPYRPPVRLTFLGVRAPAGL
jgi:hypothetical protein